MTQLEPGGMLVVIEAEEFVGRVVDSPGIASEFIERVSLSAG